MKYNVPSDRAISVLRHIGDMFKPVQFKYCSLRPIVNFSARSGLSLDLASKLEETK